MTTNTAIKSKILELLERLDDPAKTICPSEVVRDLYPDDWRDHMGDVRGAAKELVDSGEIEVTQKGAPVEIESVSGPIRLRKRLH